MTNNFDICLMNPPYGDESNGGMFLDMQFVEKVNEIANKQIVIHPFTRWSSNTKIGKKNAESGHLKEIDIIDANKQFNISSSWKYGGIYLYDNNDHYDMVSVTFNDNKQTVKYNDYSLRKEIYKNLEYSQDILKIIEKLKDLRQKLFDMYKTMVNDGHGFIYEENRLERGKKSAGILKPNNKRLDKVRKYIKEGTYKYCIYKGSFNHEYNEVQEWKGQDPDELFKGQICWLTNSETVKNNIKYWMECPLFDLWKKYYMGFSGNGVNGCHYAEIPALDFEMNKKDFREYVDSLNDFTVEEIQVLKDNKIHNADNYNLDEN